MKKIILTVLALSVAIATSCNKDGEVGLTTMVRLN